MAKHAKPKERIIDWPLTKRGEIVVALITTAAFLLVVALTDLLSQFVAGLIG
jgi:hypothetical protein